MKVSDYVKAKNINPLLFKTPEGRRAVCRRDPLLFAYVYLPHKLTDPESGEMTLSEFHLAMNEYGRVWTEPRKGPAGPRDAFISPRGCGKSTWLIILVLWAAAYEYTRFVAWFSDTSTQAEERLMEFKMELADNALLKQDFADLCDLKKGADRRAIADNTSRTIRANGFVFDANGIDTNSLGKNVGGKRPDLIILDDIEKGEKNYSEYQAGQQKNTVFDDIAPMGAPGYRMVFVGTTTMPNSIMDQFRKFSTYTDDKELQWIKDQDISVHYFPAILQNEDGTERSVWEDKWPLEWLVTKRHTRDFAKNFMNQPSNLDGQFWENEDLVVKEGTYGKTIISLDPAVTKNKVSDYSGIAVVSWGEDENGKECIFVREAIQVKMGPSELAEKVALMAEVYDAGVIYVEVNQGGDLWKNVFKDVPVKYVSKHQSVSKQIRAGKALDYYQKNRVFHTKRFPILEEQMFAFPKVSHDDVLDAVVSGILFFTERKRSKVTAKQFRYTN